MAHRKLFVNRMFALRRGLRSVVSLLLLACAASGLVACGKKPGFVDPPQGASSTLLRTYPDPQTDPTP